MNNFSEGIAGDFRRPFSLRPRNRESGQNYGDCHPPLMRVLYHVAPDDDTDLKRVYFLERLCFLYGPYQFQNINVDN